MSDVVTYEVHGRDRKRLAAAVVDPEELSITVRTSAGIVELPATASTAVRRLLEELAAGTSVHLVSDDAELTTQQAGDLLGISRTYVSRLVDQGKIPAHRVGTHRRLRAADVLAYKARRAARLSAVDDIAVADRAAGVPYR
jgi:excisionase family DNA binding protein